MSPTVKRYVCEYEQFPRRHPFAEKMITVRPKCPAAGVICDSGGMAGAIATCRA